MDIQILLIKKSKKDELLKHLTSIPSKPKAIPYVTSYYKKYWGFCISEEQKKEIKKNYKKSDSFKVLIDSRFKRNGFMNYGELFLPGKSKQEILISTYICHPSMANNELSGPIVSMGLINFLEKQKMKVFKIYIYTRNNRINSFFESKLFRY